MSSETQRELLDYAREIQPKESKAQQELRQATMAHPYHGMQILPEQGRLLAWLVAAFQVKTLIEIGVFTGYSALCMAESLPEEGRLFACDHHPEWPAIGQPYWQAAGVADRIQWVQSDGLEFLNRWIQKPLADAVDMIFIDADKRQYDLFYEAALEVVRPGGLIVMDNVFLMGRVVTDPEHKKTRISMRAFNEKLASDPRVDVVVLPIADGMTCARKLA